MTSTLTNAQLAADARSSEERLLIIAAKIGNGGNYLLADEVRMAVETLRQIRRELEVRVEVVR